MIIVYHKFVYLGGYLKCGHFMDPREDGEVLKSDLQSLGINDGCW